MPCYATIAVEVNHHDRRFCAGSQATVRSLPLTRSSELFRCLPLSDTGGLCQCSRHVVCCGATVAEGSKCSFSSHARSSVLGQSAVPIRGAVQVVVREVL